MQRDEQIRTALDAEACVHVGALRAGPEPDERVDHGVADGDDALVRHALGAVVLRRLGAVRQAQVGDLVDEHAVQLLRHRPVVAAQSRLDVRHGNPELRRSECGGERRVDVAGNEHERRLLAHEDLLEALERAGSLRAVRARADAEQVSGRRNAQLVEQHVGHLAVVVLPRVDADVPPLGKPRAERMLHGRHLHEVGPRADDVGESLHE